MIIKRPSHKPYVRLVKRLIVSFNIFPYQRIFRRTFRWKEYFRSSKTELSSEVVQVLVLVLNIPINYYTLYKYDTQIHLLILIQLGTGEGSVSDFIRTKVSSIENIGFRFLKSTKKTSDSYESSMNWTVTTQRIRVFRRTGVQFSTPSIFVFIGHNKTDYYTSLKRLQFLHWRIKSFDQMWDGGVIVVMIIVSISWVTYGLWFVYV